jgi:glycosyltransferase involved in cell wall biosynthesis
MTNEKPKVSVIIPVYNRAHYIPRVLASLQAQTLSDFEAILIDDGSSDHPEEMLCEGSSRIKIIRQEHRGPGPARNRGIDIALGEYLVFLDVDDMILPDKLEIQARYLDGHPDISLVYSNGYLVRSKEDGSEERILFSDVGLLKSRLGRPEENVCALSVGNVFPIHAAMVRKQAILETGGFDETGEMFVLEDWDLWYRTGERHQFAYEDIPTIAYYVHEGGISKDKVLMLKASVSLERKIVSSPEFSRLPYSAQARSHLVFGNIAMKFGDPDLARARYLKAIQKNPLNLGAWAGFGLTLLGRERSLRYFNLLRDKLVVRGRLHL